MNHTVLNRLLLGLNCALLCLIGLPAIAQIDVTYPVERMIVQRNNNNQATVQVAGSYAQLLDAVEARAVARSAGQGTTTDWTTLQANPINGQFNGTLQISGGWYQIEVRGRRNGQIVATDAVTRFGVGEVFAILGHSNAQGSSCIRDGVDYCTTIDGATDDRVTVVPLNQSTPEFRAYEQTANTNYLPGLVFNQLATYSGLSPFAQFSWFWGKMGDLLVQRINVPVLIYNAGFGGSNMEANYKSAYDIPFDHFFIKYAIRMPYVNIRNIMNLYVPATGIRSVLIHHGENDRSNATDVIATHYFGVIDKVRQEFSKPNLSMLVATSSYVGGRFDNVRNAQAQVINRSDYNVFPGPDLDNMTARPDGIHYSPDGQRQVAQLWSDAITNDFFTKSQPYMAEPQQLISATCAPGNQLQITLPTSASYTWNTGSTDQSLTVGTGTYSARLRSDQNKITFPPAITVPTEIRPADPTISAQGSPSFCLPGNTVLQANYSGNGLTTWNTGATSTSLAIGAVGTYSVQTKGAAYGCLSNSVAYTVNPAGSDLALSMAASRRVPAVGDTVTFTLTVRNEGGCQVGFATIANRLPPNLTPISSPTLPFTNSVVSGTISTLMPGQAVTQQYVARVAMPGVYQNAAEIMTQDGPDPDSQPGSGTGDGQDDEAQVDFRAGNGSTLFGSPNPNQVPLPTVQSNQPTPDPAKADISLSMQIDRRTVVIGQTVSISLTVSNLGGLTAGRVGVQHLLPTGLSFVSSPDFTASGSTLSAVLSSIAPGSSATVSFLARASSTGSLTNMAQISSSTQADPDSTPGNGYTNGEDDTAQLDVRVTGLSGGRQAAFSKN
ncbi:putative repeat protein (TIGR01451 family) [Spirosoma oryzae]|uniref:Putative repeat protein (TIGR01451 family) n=1 Tax=Spirosoma oryzae TaxID=1469603 RepID=A0A2T0TBD6_9BACT|nr:sialate O-acetylesterase [Spirosoma oryzae]PRY42958.1 putative repeat protein (TIGR01451 family) [Spirosoma oryzae]